VVRVAGWPVPFFPTRAAAPSSIGRLDDGELLDRARRGDTEAFGALVDRHGPAVRRAAMAVLGSCEEADDVAQEAFVTAFRKLDTFRGEAAFRTWLLRIAWREAQDWRRRLRRRLRRFVAAEDEESFTDPAPHRPSQEETLAGAELRGHIRRLVAALPARLREPLLLAATGEHSYDEIALILGAPTGTVKWRVAEARKRLKERLARLGYRHA
jgi:RNA polymerase sigma factor (sigma-70 family)